MPPHARLRPPRLWSGGARLGNTTFAVLLGYGLVSFLWFGLRPVIQPGRQYIGVFDDPQIPIWSFAWWPHAIAHGLNPFVTHAVWAPHGVNLAWVNSMPPLALLFAPLTWAFGPVVSYNIAAVLLPAFAAWTAFLLCRHLTDRLWPSIVGGYLFGFSSYMLGHMAGQPQLTAVFCIPLTVLLVLRYIEGSLAGRRLVVWLGLVLGLQFYLSLEVALTLTVALVGALVLALLLVPERRSRLIAALRPLAAAYAVGAVVAAPLLYYALTDLRRSGFQPPGDYVADLLNFVIPTHFEAIGAGWTHTVANHFPGNDTERGVFLGLPLLVIIALYAHARWRTQGGRFLLACLVVAAYAALGPKLTVDGHHVVTLPTVFGHDSVDVPGIGKKSVPLFNNTLPVRFAVYVALAAAVIAALWMAKRAQGVALWLLPALTLLVLVPNVALGTTTYSIPPFFTDPSYRPCIEPDAIVFPEPVGGGGQAMLWQAESGFRYRLAGGRLQTSPPSAFLHPDSIAQISVGYPPVRDQTQLLRAYFQKEHVGYAIVDKREAAIWAPAIDRIAVRHDVGGVLLYDLAGRLSPTCPQR
jgi:hypothetical protein